jgi:hypothetical protein
MFSKKYRGGSGWPPTKPLKFQESGSAEQHVARLKYHLQGGRHLKLFRPLRATDVYIDSSGTEVTSNEEEVPGKTGRPPPIILPSTTNLLQLQKQLQSVVKDTF